MKQRSKIFTGGFAAGASGLANAQGVTLVSDGNRVMTIIVFTTLFLLTLGITYLAARRNKSVGDFYTAGGSIPAKWNGLAIAGDYLSAAAFLGVSGLIALYGLDGMAYVVGFFISFIPVLILVAEPCRNLGKYTLGDVLSFRNHFRSTKSAVATSSILVALFYMVPQIVGGAVIIRALIGVPYETSVIAVGVLMLGYVMFGGMRATTSVQILKAGLLIGFCFVLVVLSWIPYGFDIGAFFRALTLNEEIQQHVLSALLPGSAGLSPTEAGQRFLEPGLYLKNPLEQISLSLALVLGTAAMPHILMRFFTVPNARSARSSALYAMFAIGVCHLLIVVIGFSAALNVGPAAVLSLDKGGNLAAPMLAQFLGGGPESFMGNLMLAFVSAVSFATIVAVVAGLTLAAASSLAHDVWVGAIRGGQASESEQATAARVATLAMAVISIVAGMAAKGQNVAQLVGLGYAVAASANLPALLLTLYWRRCSSAGVLAGVIGGTILSIGLVLVSPNMSYPRLQRASAMANVAAIQEKQKNADSGVLVSTPQQRLQWQRELESAQITVRSIDPDARSVVGLRQPLIDLRNPGIISIPVGFLLVLIFSLLRPSSLSSSRWAELAVRRETGLGVAKAIAH
ncbi:cation acetate symporter [Variovorax sp. EBFNA2]|uniref:solute symporter family protein n=1 Tax=Variovorax sp. EBFNA2 TaxID=3342097 RepID=UPI0029C08F69|nr:cation acetate symporter [Variovorax boronicumulans]WPG41611.1 cation acetate symporter [Variovorax boronicumulans]